MPVSARSLAQMRAVPFAALCLLSVFAGTGTALGIIFAWAYLLRFPTAFPMDYLFLILVLMGIVAPPIVLLQMRRGPMDDVEGVTGEPRPASTPPQTPTRTSTSRPNDPKGYYARLGIEATATTDEIKAAYRTQVKAFHPDTNPAGDANIQWFQQLNEAYRVLGSPEKRLEYDFSQLVAPSAAVTATKSQQVGTTNAAPGMRAPRERVASPLRRSRAMWPLLAFGALTLAGAVGFGLFVGAELNKPVRPSATKPEPSPSFKLCVQPVQGPAEVFSTVPTVQIATFAAGLRSGKYAFNYGIDGMEAARQLAYSRRFAEVYGEAIELVKQTIASKGSVTVQNAAVFLENILAEEQAIDRLLAQRDKSFTSIIFVRALQDGYCGFPNAYAENVPPADAVLGELVRTFPRISLQRSDSLFSSLYNRQLDRERDEGRRPGGYSVFKTVASLRHEILAVK